MNDFDPFGARRRTKQALYLLPIALLIALIIYLLKLI